MTGRLTANDFFSGAGGLGLGFKYAGFDLSGAWDFNRDAVESYKKNVSEKITQADISKMSWEDVPYADVWTFGFPCQDISIAGKQAGMIKGKTRSGLFYEIIRLLEETRDNDTSKLPKIIMAENVRPVSKLLPIIQEEYGKAGYKMFAAMMNSKFWGVPQNRQRYFIVGVHESIERNFSFPEQQGDILVKLKHILEEDVDKKYFVRDIEKLGVLEKIEEGYKVRQATKLGYDIAVPGDAINVSHPKSKTRRGRVGKQVAQTLLTSSEQVVVLDDGSVRYFTPREFARLQGFPDTYEITVSDTQFYKQMGNAVTVNLAKAMAEQIKSFLEEL